jgi:hypothetical protein
MILFFEFQIILEISNNDKLVISNDEFQIIFMHNSIINFKTQNFQKKSKNSQNTIISKIPK